MLLPQLVSALSVGDMNAIAITGLHTLGEYNTPPNPNQKEEFLLRTARITSRKTLSHLNQPTDGPCNVCADFHLPRPRRPVESLLTVTNFAHRLA